MGGTGAQNREALAVCAHEVDVVGGVASALELARLDAGLERLEEVADLLARRQAERGHHLEAEALRQRRRLAVLFLQLTDARAEIADLAEAALALLGPLGRDVRAREVEQIDESIVHLLRETAHRAVGPRGVVLARAQVVQDQVVDALEGVALEAEALADALAEHRRADLAVTEEVHLAVRLDGARLHLADVVQQRAPANGEARHALQDDLLRVLPDVLVPPLSVAEADEHRHLRQPHVERSGETQCLETFVRLLAEEQAIQLGACVCQRDGAVLRGTRAEGRAELGTVDTAAEVGRPAESRHRPRAIHLLARCLDRLGFHSRLMLAAAVFRCSHPCGNRRRRRSAAPRRASRSRTGPDRPCGWSHSRCAPANRPCRGSRSARAPDALRR